MSKGKYFTHVEPKLFLVECWARDGLTDEQIAKKVGVAYSTFRDYKNKYSALSAALKKGKEIIDYEVENALLKRALGFKYNEITQELTDIKTDSGTITTMQPTKIVTKQVAPDVGAIAIWLKNRKPDKWRDRPKDDADATGQLEQLIKGIKQDE